MHPRNPHAAPRQIDDSLAQLTDDQAGANDYSGLASSSASAAASLVQTDQGQVSTGAKEQSSNLPVGQKEAEATFATCDSLHCGQGFKQRQFAGGIPCKGTKCNPRDD